MKKKDTIRVILADDHAVIRRGIRKILEKHRNIVVVGESSTGEGAIQLVDELQPDVLVLDIEMPDMKGYQVARELRKRQIPVFILALSACDDDHFIQETVQSGMDGYLIKSEAPAKILQAVYHISRKYQAIELIAIHCLGCTALGGLFG